SILVASVSYAASCHLRCCYKCSTRLGAGDCAGHSNTSTPLYSNHLRAIREVCLGVVVLLENDFVHVQPVVSERFDKIVTEDLRIELYVHAAINTSRVAHALGCHTAPKH